MKGALGEHMTTDRTDNLSFIIKTTGEIVPAMPDDEEFSPSQLRDYVAGPPEVVCKTHDGFFLFHNKEGKARGLPVNELATAMYLSGKQKKEGVVGRVLVAHPDHIPAFWKSIL
jgi:hypothetical protein